jgi:magnesium transporter
MEKLMELLKTRRLTALRRELADMNVVDIAEFLGGMSAEDALTIFRILPKDAMADVFSYLEPDRQEELITAMTDREIVAVIDDLFLDDAVDFLEEVPANVVKRVLRLTDAKTSEQLQQFLQYPKDSAGALMTVEFMELHDRTTVRQALDHIRETGFDKETIYTCYVIDDTHHLVGTVALRKLITSPESSLLRNIMEDNVIAVATNADQETVALEFGKYDLMTMPVVDNENRLVGLITVDDIMDVIQEENTEDIEKMAAMKPSGGKEYLRTSVFELARNRIPWLLLLMLSATFTGGIIAHYEGLLASAMVLSTFIPMLMDTAGNSGSQSSVLIIRGLALDEVRPRDVFRVLFKELRVALIAGAALSLVNFARIMIFQRGTGIAVALGVSASLCITVIMAKLIGGFMPLLAKKLGFDPAVMAAPLITTIVDALALVVFFNVATGILNIV